jgi:hypothetical protein
MRQIELAETLVALVEGIEPPQDSGLVVTEAVMEVPMEVSGVLINDSMVFFAAPPHTRWKSGVLPTVHRTVLRIELVENGESSGEQP